MSMKTFLFLPLLFLVITASCLPAVFLAGFFAGCRHDDGPCVTCPPPGPDTTSHNFTWTIDTLGDGNSSTLYDVAIINDTLAYAVGEIYLKDTTGQIEYPAHSVAIWNGKSWRLKRLTALGPTGVISNLTPRGIWAFSETNVWLASGGVFFWDGQSASTTPYWINSFPGNPSPILLAGQTAEKIWGSSSSNLFAVGRAGGIAYYNGTTWQKLESGTTVDIQDVWGAIDAQGNRNVLCAASYVYQVGPMLILSINTNQTVDTVSWGTGRRVHSVWSSDNTTWYSAGGGVFTRHGNEVWKEQTELPLIFTRLVRGNASNDVLVAGDFGFVAHYNGSNWKYYTGTELPTGNAILTSVAFHGNIVIVCGVVGDRTILYSGKRN